MKISIIIVSYNVCSYLRQCLNSIYKTSIIQDSEIIVVDNFSHDHTCKMLNDEYSDVRLIRNHMNHGFSKAVNIGQVYAKGEYLCILNPDTLISENTFIKLLTYIEKHPKVGCIGPKILNSDGSLQLASKRSFPHPMTAFFKFTGLSRLFPKSHLFGRYNLTYLDENKIHNVDALSGSFMLIPSKIFLEVGKFDESFFMYGEDLDYCYRIQKHGYDLIYNPETSIIHYKGESVKSAPFDIVSIFYSAMNTFYRKYSNDFPLWKFIRPFVSIGINFRKMITYLRNYSTKIIAWQLDTVSITICFGISFFSWFSYYYGGSVTINSIIIHWPLLVDLIISWTVSSYWLNLYKKNYLSYGRSLVTAVMTLFLSATSTYFIGSIAYSRVVLFLTVALAAVLTASWRIILHLLYYYRKINISARAPLFSHRAVIIGTGDESMRIGNILKHAPGYHFILVGYIDDQNLSNTEQFIGYLKDIDGLVKKHHINEIIIPESWAGIRRLIQFLHELKDLNINCKLVPEGQKMLIGKGVVENLSGIPLIDIELPLFEKLHKITKRIFDFILSAVLIFLTFPVHVCYLLTGRVDEKNVWSINGEHIHVYQYQSKKLFIQDLPLLFMIFKGDISFVGTQIIEITHQNPSSIIKPGLIGLSNIKTSNIYPNSLREYEQYYAMHYSLVFDIEIILKSILRI